MTHMSTRLLEGASMHDYDEDNDGKFPDESRVEVRYPRCKQEEQGDREQWPWLPCCAMLRASPWS
jgi:hypothetical protein